MECICAISCERLLRLSLELYSSFIRIAFIVEGAGIYSSGNFEVGRPGFLLFQFFFFSKSTIIKDNLNIVLISLFFWSFLTTRYVFEMIGCEIEACNGFKIIF